MSTENLENPILNSPYEVPARHFELSSNGPTGVILDGRRASQSFVPVPVQTKKGSGDVQEAFDFDVTGERLQRNDLINQVRQRVDLWRARGYPNVTPYTRKLLTHWSAGPPVRDEPVFLDRKSVV